MLKLLMMIIYVFGVRFFVVEVGQLIDLRLERENFTPYLDLSNTVLKCFNLLFDTNGIEKVF